jgi:hypothetical protein
MADDAPLDTAEVLRRLRERAEELASTPRAQAEDDSFAAALPEGGAADAGASASIDGLTTHDISRMDARQVETATFAAAERLQGTLIRTYRHLRLVLVAVAPAILISIAAVWNTGFPSLPSLSHYYYTPARMVFAGALVTAAAALLALSGRGSQRGLLDLAALFAPLIALVPTKIENGQVPGLDDVCPQAAECLPADVGVYVATGGLVWFVFAIGVLGYGTITALIARAGGDPATRQDQPSTRGTWIPIATGAVIVAVAAALWIWANETFLEYAHFVSASLFFVIITVVAVNRARRARIDSDADEGAWRWIPALVTTFPGWIALLMAVDLVAAVAVLVGDVSGPLVILGVPFGAVFAVEAIALILFTVFWLYETRRKWNEADPD